MTQTLPPTQAPSRLQQAAGSRFDPRVVEALQTCLSDLGALSPEPSGRPEYATD